MIRVGYIMIIFGSLFCFAKVAEAQAVAPMEKSITSFTDKFVVQISIQNPYKTAQVSQIEVFDANWQPVREAILTTRKTLLGAGASMSVTALVPFSGQTRTHVYICHSITPRTGGRGSAYRGEVCGKYTARRLSA